MHKTKLTILILILFGFFSCKKNSGLSTDNNYRSTPTSSISQDLSEIDISQIYTEDDDEETEELENDDSYNDIIDYNISTLLDDDDILTSADDYITRNKTLRPSAGTQTITDMNGNYYHLTTDGYGNTTGFDSEGNYYNYHTDDYGNTTGFDSNGNYMHSHTDFYGNTTGFDSNGNYYHYHTDDYGNTTGFDGDGNFISAHTDDYGNTTINVY